MYCRRVLHAISFFVLMLGWCDVALAQTVLSGNGIQLEPNDTFPVAPSDRARIRYNDGTQAFEQSINTGSWVPLGGVASVSNVDGSLTISPTTGNIVASLNVAHDNIWTGHQTFNTVAMTFGAGANATGAFSFDLTGSSGTFKTSTGANQLSGNTTVSDTKTFTMTDNGITVPTSIAFLYNNTAATSGSANQSLSPALEFGGQQWNGAASVLVQQSIYELPVTGSTQGAWLAFRTNYNSAGAFDMLWTSGGTNVAGDTAVTIIGNPGTTGGSNGTLILAAGSSNFVNPASSNLGGYLALGDYNHTNTALHFANSTLFLNGTFAILSALGTSDTALEISTSDNVSLGGSGIFYFINNYNSYNMVGTGSFDFAAPVVESMQASGVINAGDVVVWVGGVGSLGNKVAQSAASANLTTIAGVALSANSGGGGGGGTIQVVTFGRTLTNCEAGVNTVGMLVGTSGSTAGWVDASSPGAGAIVGRDTVVAGGTITAGGYGPVLGANQCYVYVNTN